jgi:hypothetical protein
MESSGHKEKRLVFGQGSGSQARFDGRVIAHAPWLFVQGRVPLGRSAASRQAKKVQVSSRPSMSSRWGARYLPG